MGLRSLGRRLFGGKPSGPQEIVVKSGKLESVSIAAFPCPKVNNKGLTGAWWWADKIAIAVALWATAETWKAAKEEYKIGKRYYDLAKEQWDFFYEFYRPLEEQELNEIWAEQPYTPDYPTAVAGHTHLIDNTFAGADSHRRALARKYCVCLDISQFTKTDITQSTIRGDSDNFARRYAEKLAQERNDIRWARRISAASRGRGLLSDSASFAGRASGFFRDYATAMGGVAQGAMAFSGYVRNRNQTEYNAPHSRIHTRMAVPNFNYGDGQYAQNYFNYNTLYHPQPTGGINWANYDGEAPYMQSGLDPTGFGRVYLQGSN